MPTVSLGSFRPQDECSTAEAAGYSGTSFRESTSTLFRISLLTLPASLVVAIARASLLRSWSDHDSSSAFFDVDLTYCINLVGSANERAVCAEADAEDGGLGYYDAKAAPVLARQVGDTWRFRR